MSNDKIYEGAVITQEMIDAAIEAYGFSKREAVAYLKRASVGMREALVKGLKQQAERSFAEDENTHVETWFELEGSDRFEDALRYNIAIATEGFVNSIYDQGSDSGWVNATDEEWVGAIYEEVADELAMTDAYAPLRLLQIGGRGEVKKLIQFFLDHYQERKEAIAEAKDKEEDAAKGLVVKKGLRGIWSGEMANDFIWLLSNEAAVEFLKQFSDNPVEDYPTDVDTEEEENWFLIEAGDRAYAELEGLVKKSQDSQKCPECGHELGEDGRCYNAECEDYDPLSQYSDKGEDAELEKLNGTFMAEGDTLMAEGRTVEELLANINKEAEPDPRDYASYKVSSEAFLQEVKGKRFAEFLAKPYEKDKGSHVFAKTINIRWRGHPGDGVDYDKLFVYFTRDAKAEDAATETYRDIDIYDGGAEREGVFFTIGGNEFWAADYHDAMVMIDEILDEHRAEDAAEDKNDVFILTKRNYDPVTREQALKYGENAGLEQVFAVNKKEFMDLVKQAKKALIENPNKWAFNRLHLARKTKAFDATKGADDHSEEEENVTGDEYERLAYNATYGTDLLDLYDLDYRVAQLIEDSIAELGLVQDDEWAIAPEVLKSHESMTKLYNKVVDKVKKLAAAGQLEKKFDSDLDRHYGRHNTVDEIKRLLDLVTELSDDDDEEDAKAEDYAPRQKELFKKAYKWYWESATLDGIDENDYNALFDHMKEKFAPLSDANIEAILSDALKPVEESLEEENELWAEDAIGEDFFGTAEGTEKADDILFALQAITGNPKLTYKKARELYKDKDAKRALAYVKTNGLNKHTYFEDAKAKDAVKEEVLSEWTMDGDTYKITRAPNGRIFNNYGKSGQAGPFATEEEAEKMLKKHRPTAQLKTKRARFEDNKIEDARGFYAKPRMDDYDDNDDYDDAYNRWIDEIAEPAAEKWIDQIISKYPYLKRRRLSNDWYVEGSDTIAFNDFVGEYNMRTQKEITPFEDSLELNERG